MATVTLPNAPILISSTCGGPFVIYLCTPLRNALTLGSRDALPTMGQLYRKAFRGGLSSGWVGGTAPAVAACPQFFALGPIYHGLNDLFRKALGLEAGGHSLIASSFAASGAGLAETLLTYGSQSRNAQMAYNNTFVTHSSIVDAPRSMLPLNRPYQIWGVGAGCLTIRNACGLAGVRGLSPCLEQRLPQRGPLASKSAHAAVCTALAAVLTCVVTSPVHQTFNFLITSPDVHAMSSRERSQLIGDFLTRQYFVPRARPSMDFGTLSLAPPGPEEYTWRISRVAGRDFVMRAAYVTCIFTLYTSIERFMIANYHSFPSLSHYDSAPAFGSSGAERCRLAPACPE